MLEDGEEKLVAFGLNLWKRVIFSINTCRRSYWVDNHIVPQQEKGEQWNLMPTK